MQIPQSIDLSFRNILKYSGVMIAVVVVIVIIFRLIGVIFDSFAGVSTSNFTRQGAGSYFGIKTDESSDMAYAESSGGIASLSVRNVNSKMAPATDNGIATGDTSEQYEVKEYDANIETRDLDGVCGRIAGLKPREDVVFESANEYEKNCSFRFKVKQGSVDEIIAFIKSLDPKDFDERAYTIKQVVDDYTSEVDILQKKKATIESTLADAISSYDEISRIATKTQNVETLAKIIENKLNLINRLTQEKIDINSQLDRLTRSKQEQLDRLEYSYFNVRVTENRFVDWRDLKDSWKLAVKTFVRDINKVLQDLSINLVAALFIAVQYVLYFIILIVIIKYVWMLAKYIWNK